MPTQTAAERCQLSCDAPLVSGHCTVAPPVVSRVGTAVQQTGEGR